MAQRQSDYERRPRDLYETPAWVTRVLVQYIHMGPLRINGPRRLIWEPAAGTGKMVRALRDEGFTVWASDIHDEDGRLDSVGDFLDVLPIDGLCGIVTNPPYDQAAEFIRRALEVTRPVGGFVAMLLKVDFDSGSTRVDMFRDCPAWGCKIVLMDRITWFDGPSQAAGSAQAESPATMKKRANPSENHAWFVWDWRRDRSRGSENRYARNPTPKPLSPREQLRARAKTIAASAGGKTI